MLTNANIMIHSSYDNLSLTSPNVGNPTTNSNLIFDELQGRGQVSFSLSLSLFSTWCYIHINVKYYRNHYFLFEQVWPRIYVNFSMDDLRKVPSIMICNKPSVIICTCEQCLVNYFFFNYSKETERYFSLNLRHHTAATRRWNQWTRLYVLKRKRLSCIRKKRKFTWKRSI